MPKREWDGLTPQAVIDQIKQKHWKDLDVDDFAFMKARQDMLSEADLRIYVQGEDPAEVMGELGIPMTANERIIHENRPLQEVERRIRDARDEGARLQNLAVKPLNEVQRAEEDERLAEERAAKFESLEAEEKLLAKNEKDAASEAKKRADEAAKEADKAQPVKIVG